MRVLVFGTGGVGGIYAWILHNGGADVTVVCRSNYAEVSEKGITINSVIFGQRHFQPRVLRNLVEKETESYDYVVVATKSFHGNAFLIAPSVSPSTTIVLAQNGIAIEAEYADAFPNNTVVSGVVYLPTTQVAPGVIAMGNLQRLHIGSYPAATPSETIKRFAAVFEKGGGEITVHSDIQRERWIKVAVNAAWNPVCALSRCDDANFLRSSDEAETAIRALMGEVAKIAAAAGYEISQANIDEQMARPKLRMATGGKEPSMLTDVREGRALEADAIVGNAIKEARRLGVEVPRLEMVYAMIKGLGYSIVRDDKWMDIA